MLPDRSCDNRRAGLLQLFFSNNNNTIPMETKSIFFWVKHLINMSFLTGKYQSSFEVKALLCFSGWTVSPSIGSFITLRFGAEWRQFAEGVSVWNLQESDLDICTSVPAIQWDNPFWADPSTVAQPGIDAKLRKCGVCMCTVHTSDLHTLNPSKKIQPE